MGELVGLSLFPEGVLFGSWDVVRGATGSVEGRDRPDLTCKCVYAERSANAISARGCVTTAPAVVFDNMNPVGGEGGGGGCRRQVTEICHQAG